MGTQHRQEQKESIQDRVSIFVLNEPPEQLNDSENFMTTLTEFKTMVWTVFAHYPYSGTQN